MPTPAAVGDCFAVSTRSTYLGQPVINTVHVVITSSTLGMSTQQWSVGLNAATNPLAALVVAAASDDLAIREISTQWIFRVGDPWPAVAHLTYRSPVNLPGLQVGDPLPGQPSLTISTYGEFGTSKAVRGGVRLSGLVEPVITDGLFTGSFLSEIAAEVAACFLNPWDVDLPEASTGTVLPVIFSYTAWERGDVAVYTGIDSTAVRQVPGTIRRRKEYSSQGGYPV